MTDDTLTDDAVNETPDPGVRYFRDPEDGGIQEVHGLTDDAPYVDLGYEEISEADYLAAIQAIETAMGTPDVPELQEEQ